MSPQPEVVEAVEVQLELGHNAVPKPRNQFTHQWTLFVRGPDNCRIEEFVEKVVFNLHESFPKPRRVLTKPPYEVKEYGYASFELPIDIFFRNKEEPKKITYRYDLFLQPEAPVHNTRREKLTFKNPAPEFKKKLLRAGGKCYPNPKNKPTAAVPPKQKAKHAPASPLTPNSNPTASPHDVKPVHKSSAGDSKPISQQRIPQKDIPSHSVSSSSSSGSSNSLPSKSLKDKPPLASKPPPDSKPDPFTDLFGPPLQSRPSPEPGRQQKERSRKERPTNGSKGSKSVSSEKKESGHSASSTLPDTFAPADKSAQFSPSSQKKDDHKAQKKSRKSKSKKKDVRRKRRDSSSSSRSSSSSSSCESNSGRPSGKTNNSSKTHKSPPDSPHDAKSKGKEDPVGGSQTSGPASNSSQKSKDVKREKENFTSTTISYINNNNTGTTTLEIKSVKKEKTWDSESKRSKSKDLNSDAAPDTGSKSASSSAKHSRNRHSKRELSSSPPSPDSDRLSVVGHQVPANGTSSPPSGRARKRQKLDSGSDSDDAISCKEVRDKQWKSTDKSEGEDEQTGSDRRSKYLMDPETELKWIQKRINEAKDPILLQRIVDMIENNTSTFELTETSFNFDLRRLDSETLSKLRTIVEQG